MPDNSLYWRRNLYVCLFGSFTTLLAMTLLLPFLPIYVEQLGVEGHAAIVQWSGVAYGITFLGAGVMAPIWGRFADLYGRKPILMRAALAMAVCMSLIGLAQNIWQLVALRLAAGLLGGYSSGAVVLVATQTPRERSGWALGVLSTGTLAGTLLGPLMGGIMPGLIGIRATFFAAGAVIFVAFLATVFLVREDRSAFRKEVRQVTQRAWSMVPDRRPVITMLVTAMLLLFANMSVEPIITVYVGQLKPPGGDVVFTAGLVMAASAVGSIVAAPRLGRWADRRGHWSLIVWSLAGCSVLLIPQAFVTNSWQLIGLRFLMGVALAGLLPAITATIRHNVPQAAAGTILGYSTSAQYAGQVLGPLAGGFVGGQIGMRAVFGATTLVMAGGALLNWWVSRQIARKSPLGDDASRGRLAPDERSADDRPP
ncbi:MAG: MFS transporter [Acetobacteraceae bacterium]|nr:MFS transporter [Acetobacteraceae bacterium]